MSIFFADFKIIGRSKGQSAVASAAYQSGENLIEEETQQKKRFSQKAWQVKYSEIMLPEHAPKEYGNRETLWNAVQKKERAKNAQFARKAVFALPKELDRETQIKLSRTYIQENFVNQGMVADWSIHDKGDGNPHVHIQLTTRPFTKSGKWGSKWKSQFKLNENGNRIPIIDPETGMQKVLNGRKKWQRENITLDWNRPEKVTEWRNAWEKVVNPYLKEINAPEISAKSYEDQGIDRISTLHEGYFARKIEKERPGSSRVIAINRAIKARNHAVETMERVEKQIEEFIEKWLSKGEGSLDEILGGSRPATDLTDEARHREGLPVGVGQREPELVELAARVDRATRESERGYGTERPANQPAIQSDNRIRSRKSELESRKRQFDKLTGRRDQQKPELATASSITVPGQAEYAELTKQAGSRAKSRIIKLREDVQRRLDGQSIRDTESPTPNKRMETSLQTARTTAIELRSSETRQRGTTSPSQPITATNSDIGKGQGDIANTAPSMGILDIIKQIITWLTERLERGRRQRAELEKQHQDLESQIAAAEKLKEQAKTKSQQAKKPEKTAKVASKQPVQVQSKPVVHPDRPKRSQDRSIKHDQEQKAWRMAYTLCTIPSMLTLAARKGVAALMTLKKADAKQATATQKRAAIAKITKNLGLKSEFDYLAQQDFDKAYTSMLAEYFVLCATGAFSTPEAVKKYEKGFVQYEKWFEDNQEPEKALEKYFKNAKQQAEKVLATYNRTPEKDFPRPQQTPPRRRNRGRSR